jgi:hypothetical protein
MDRSIAMPKPTPNLGVSRPKSDPAALRGSLKEAATPATHAGTATRRQRRKADTQLVGAHLSPDVGRQLRLIAAEEDTDVKSLLVEAINMLFKTRGKPQIADDQIKR